MPERNRRRGPARAGARPRRPSAAGVRRRAHQLRRGRPSLGTAGPRPDRARRGQGHARRAAVPQRCGVRGRHAGRRAHRRRRRPVLHVRDRAAKCTTQLVHSDVEILLAAASYRSHDYRATARTNAGERLSCVTAFIDIDRVYRRSRTSVDETLLDGDGRRRRRIGHAGDRVHVGFDQRPEGCRAHPRGAARTSAQPQRDPRADRATTSCSATRRSSGSAVSRSGCSPRCSPARRWCAPTPSTPATRSICWRPRSRR